MAHDGNWLDLGFYGVRGLVWLSSNGYEERDGITILRWCSPTQEIGLKVGGTTRKLELRGCGDGNMVRGRSMGPFIGARVPVGSKQSFEAYLQGNQRLIW
jgi:hypothetical protein